MKNNTRIDEIKSRMDIADLVGETVSLERRGRDLWGLCPFHGEKTPSFMVSRDKQRFRCWGCGTSGDVIDFVMKRDRLNFSAARDHLAARAGLRVEVSPADREAIRQVQEKREKEKERQAKGEKFVRDEWGCLIKIERRCHRIMGLVRTERDLDRPQTVWAAHTISKVESVLNDLEKADDTEKMRIVMAVRGWQL